MKILLGFFLSIFFSLSALGQVLLQSEISYSPADTSRTYMDVAGVWNGSSNATNSTGDRLLLKLTNPSGSGDSAYNLEARVHIPHPNINFIPGSESLSFVGAGCGVAPSVVVAQVGRNVTASFTPTGYDLPEDCAMNFEIGVWGNHNLTQGSKKVIGQYRYGETDGGALPLNFQKNKVNFLAKKGELSLTGGSEGSTELAVTEVLTVNSRLCNQGDGGLFNVTIDNKGSALRHQSFSLTSQTPSLDASQQPSVTTNADEGKMVFPYLKPGQCVLVKIKSEVISCSVIEHKPLFYNDGLGFAWILPTPVTLDLTTPLVSFTNSMTSSLNPINVPETGVNHINIPIYNTGLGLAKGFSFSMPIPATVLMTNLSPDWTYSGGVFTYTGSTEGIISGTTGVVNLSFDVAKAPQCPPVAAQTLVVPTRAIYKDGCHNDYNLPSMVARFVIEDSLAPFTLAKTVGKTTYNPGDTGTYTLTVTRGNLNNLNDSDLVIKDTIPSSSLSSVTLGAAPGGTSVSCSGSCGPGDLVTWTIPKTILGAQGSLSLPINFTVDSSECVAGNMVTNTVNTDYHFTSANCNASDSSGVRFFIDTDDISGGLSEGNSNFSLAAASTGAAFETGLADNGDGVRQQSSGEGEFIQFREVLDFTAGGQGTWTGSHYSDTFGGLPGATLVPNSLMVKLGGGGSLNVPVSSITQSVGGLKLSLDFLKGSSYFNTDNIAGKKLEIEYSITVPDADLGTSSRLDATTLAIASIAGGGGSGAGCNTGGALNPKEYRDFTEFSIARRSLGISVSMPEIIEICGKTPITLTSQQGHQSLGLGWNPLITTTQGAYIVDGSQTPVFTGSFTGANMTSSLGNPNSSFHFTASPTLQAQSSAVKLEAILPANSPLTPQDFCAKIDHDDTQTASSVGRAFTGSNICTRPVQVVQGDLKLIVTPDELKLSSNEIEFTIIVVNTGSGVAYNPVVKDTVPSQFDIDQVKTNGVNSITPTYTGSSVVTWNIPDIQPGAQVTLKLVVKTKPSLNSCDPLTGQNNVTATWGCGGVQHQTASSSLPNFRFETGDLSVEHNPGETQAQMCQDGAGSKAVISVKNTGQSTIYALKVTEILNTGTTGISLASSPHYEYSLNGAAWAALPSSPSGVGTTASPYIFDMSFLGTRTTPGLNNGLKPLDEVKIRFNIAVGEPADLHPVIQASAKGDLSCQSDVVTPSSAAADFTIEVVKPIISFAKLGKNTESGAFSSTYSETTYAKAGDIVSWLVEVKNTGNTSIPYSWLKENFVGTGGTNRQIKKLPTGTFTSMANAVDFSLGNDIAASSTTRYEITEKLGNTCLNESNRAEFTWSCSSSGPKVPRELSPPGLISDTAGLVMLGNPVITQALTSRPNGDADINITITNTGSYMDNLVLDMSLLTGFEVDSSLSLVAQKNGTSISVPAQTGTVTAPIFTFTGESLEHNDVLTLKIPVKSTVFDTTSDFYTNPETSANGFDPVPPASGPSIANLNFNSSCGPQANVSQTTTLDPLTPDLDISVSPTSLIVQGDNEVHTFTYTITNNGDTGSVGGNIDFALTHGAGWTPEGANPTVVTLPGGTTINCADPVHCLASELGSLSAGQSLTIAFTAKASKTGGPLNLSSQVIGAGTGGNYSLDTAKSKIIGVDQTFVQKSTSETDSLANNLFIGEDIVYTSTVEFFGLEGGTTVSNIKMRNILPGGLGYISHTVTSGTFSALPTISVGGTGNLVFEQASISANTKFEYDMTLRALNNTVNVSNKSWTLPLDSQFVYESANFFSNNWSGSEAGLHDELTSTIRRPIFTVNKKGKNITAGDTSFANSINADAGDIVEYQVVISNTGSAPSYDLVLKDTPDTNNPTTTKLHLQTGSTPTGTISGNTITFNHASTGLTTPGQTMEKLDNGQSLTFTYRVKLKDNVQPNDTLNNTAELAGTTLPATLLGSDTDTSFTGTTEAKVAQTDGAQVQIIDVGLTKEIINTSIGNDTSPNVLIGEQVKFRLTVVMPSGYIPNFQVTDKLPEGLRLLANPIITYDNSIITSCVPSLISPATTPAEGSGGVLPMEMNFGNCTVSSSGTEAQRTVTIEYMAQVRNLASNTVGTTLVNSANYSFSGLSPAPTAQTVTLTIQEPSLTVSKTVDSFPNPKDAGTEVTYKILITNTGNATAYDVDIKDTLPAQMTFVSGSTTHVNGVNEGAPAFTSQVINWGRGQSHVVDIPANGTVEFTYKAKLLDTVKPAQVLTNDVDISYTSMPKSNPTLIGAPALGAMGTHNGEREKTATSSANVTVDNTYTTVKTKTSTDTVTGGGYRVGDTIDYKLSLTLQEGTTDNVAFLDTLPSGFELVSFSTVSPASSANMAYTMGAVPSSGATGTLAWNLGNVVVTGDNDTTNQTLEMSYKVRVTNNGTHFPNTPVTRTLNNSFRATYDDALGNPEQTTASVVSVQLKQPSLGITKALGAGQPLVIEAGDRISYQVTLTNNGSANAYNTKIEDTLPMGVRVAGVSSITATLNGSAVALAAPAYTSSTGKVIWTLGDAQFIKPSQTLVINYQVTADSDIAAGLTLTNSAHIEEYFSKDSTGATHRREYPATSPVSAPDVTTKTPTDMNKAVDTTHFQVGDTVTYTLSVPKTKVKTKLYDVKVTDVLPANLTFVSVTHNGAALGATVTNTTAGNHIALEFNELDPDEQATVTITARVKNISANQNAVTFNNQASFTWASSDNGAAQVAINSQAVAVTLREPSISLTKTRKSSLDVIADSAIGFQAGDKVGFTLSMANAGPGIAHQVVISDIAHVKFINPVVSANPDNPGAAISGAVSGDEKTWTWSLTNPIASGATYKFDVVFELDSTVQPQETLTNKMTAIWKSTATDNVDSRDGSGGVNDYTAGPTTVNQVSIGGIQFDKVIASTSSGNPSDNEFAIGESVFYDLTVDLVASEVKKLRVQDILPTGLEYKAHTLSLTSVQASGGGAISLTTPPSAGDTGTLTFNFGDIEATASGAKIVIRLEAAVSDMASNLSSMTLTNNSRVLFDDPNNIGTDITITDMSPVDIKVENPDILFALDGPNDIDLGETESFTARLENTSKKPAYQPSIDIIFPTEMRANDPTSLVETVAISGGRTLTLSKGLDYTTSYVAGTGIYTVNLISSQAYVGEGETLSIGYQGKLNDDTAGSLNLDFDGTVRHFYSVDKTINPSINHDYATAISIGTIGTANGLQGDDKRDNAPLVTKSPIITMEKGVDFAEVSISPGVSSYLTYTLIIKNSGNATGTVTSVEDHLSSHFKAGTLTLVSQTPACSGSCVLTLSPNGGINGTGKIDISNLLIPASSNYVLKFKVEIKDVLPNGTIIENQASADLSGFTNDIVSDSTSAADNDGVEGGNDPNDPNDDDKTKTVITSKPALRVEKTSDHAGKTGAIAEGDILTYTLKIYNEGTENTHTTKLVDVIPSFTTYIPNSTTLNSVSVADIGGVTSLESGLSVNSQGSGAGVLEVGEIGTVTFQVKVDRGLSPNAVISNQAFMTTVGDGGTNYPTVYSDDPTTSASGDPTKDYLGSGSKLIGEKTVKDINGGVLAIGDILEYIITIHNNGFTSADNGVLTDIIPAELDYIAGSLLVDENGDGSYLVNTDANDADSASVVGSNLTVNMASIAPGKKFSIRFRARVKTGTSSGTLISNQAVYKADGIPDVKTDGDGNLGNGEQPTTIIVGSSPALRSLKEVQDINGGTLLPGDELLYTITMQNLGSIGADNIIVTDTIPVGTTYVASSTTVKGLEIADVGGSSPLVSGHNIGSIPSGENIMLTFKVRANTGLAMGTDIENQASYSADGGLSGQSNKAIISLGGARGNAILQGKVWLDTNSDRIVDSTEKGEADWTVEILKDGIVVDSVKTDSSGNYIVKGLVPGSGYQVRFRHPTTNVVYGGAYSTATGADTTDGTIRSLTLYDGINLLNQNLPIDPSGVIYNSISRQPVPGVLVNMIGPAGFNPSIHLLPGQYNQITGSDGRYRFDLVPTAPVGKYKIIFTNPGSYLPGQSQIITPQAGSFDATGLPDPHSIGATAFAPIAGQPTLYYLEFDINPTDPTYPNIINNHIPIDPILDGALSVVKTTPLTNVSMGQLVPYTIKATNNLAANISNIDIADQMPPGFTYMPQSAMVGGIQVEPVSVGRKLNFSNLSFSQGETKTIKLILRVGLGVGEGEYTNSAYALNNVVNAQVSNTAQAVVRVVPDAIFDCPEIIGKVFDDTNRNGYYDKGEVGISGVEIVTARGWVIKTDHEGRYHVACPMLVNRDIGSNFVLKVNPRTLPTGYRMTSHNPKLTRLTRGKTSKVNFGASIHKVVHMEYRQGHTLDHVRGLLPLFKKKGMTLRTTFYGEKNSDFIKEFERVFKDKDVNFEYEWVLDKKVKTENIFLNQEHYGKKTPLVLKELNKTDRSQFSIQKMFGEKSIHKVIEEKIDLKPDNIITVRFPTLSAVNIKIDDIVEKIINLNNKTGVQRIHVVGHTDSDKISEASKRRFSSNIELSKARAYAVAGKLLSHNLGIQISYDGKGSQEPIAPNNSSKNKALNRRSEIYLYYKKKEQNPLLGNFRCHGKKDHKLYSVDGNVNIEDQDAQRCGDIQLEKASLQIRYNPLKAIKRLEIGPVNSYQLKAYSNYTHYIKKAELIIWDSQAYDKKLKVLPIKDLKKPIEIPQFLVHGHTYSLRVYDSLGNFDETERKKLMEKEIYPSVWGKSSLEISGISVAKGSVVSTGSGIPKGYRVFVMGEEVPVDSQGKFVVEQSLEPSVDYGIEILVIDKDNKGVEYRRDFRMPDQDWFGVGMIDLTIGKNKVNGPAELITKDDRHYNDKLYFDGRVSGYLKGKWRGEYLVTASVDTRESELKYLFSNLLDKDPRAIFRRIDPDEFYPVYGDDSTLTEDAPTKGKLYLKVQKDENYIMWGNFRTKLTQTEFSQYDRAFYGAKFHAESKRQVRSEKGTQLDVFAASPDTMTQRDEFRGTGSSFYWLNRRDIVRGSERVRVEIRDINSGIILGSRTLVAEKDYTVNYINGQIQLSSPLETYGSQVTLVRTGSGSGNPVYLVVNYEYIPGFEDLDSLALGGRFAQWLGSQLKLGVSGVRQKQKGQNFTQYGADLTYRLGNSGHLKLEWAQTDGIGNQEMSTIDGGYVYENRRANQAVKADAYFAELSLDLYKSERGMGILTTYFRKREAGFAATGQQTSFETDQYGAELKLPLGKSFELLGKYDISDEKNYVERKSLDLRADYFISDSWTFALGYRDEKREILSTGTGVLSSAIGGRQDGTAELRQKVSDDFNWYAFTQKTLKTTKNRRKNDRYGFGVDLKFKKRYILGFEISNGNGGLGGNGKIGYQISDDSEAYLNYLLENNNGDTLLTPLVGSRGQLVSGVKHRYKETSSIYYENKYEHGRNRPEGLTHAFGVELNPFEKWTFAFDFETGELSDKDRKREIERRSFSLGLAKASEKEKLSLNLEFRRDKEQTQKRETLLAKARYDRQLNPSWKLLTRFLYSQSESSLGAYHDGDYMEGALAFAFRPVTFDKFNMLFRYSYTELLPSVGQVSTDGSIPDFRQRTSQLSLDMVYDLNKYLSLGLKYGFALRSLQNSRVGGNWFNSNAHLGVLRFDFHIVKSWDFILEGRRLWFEGNEQARMGTLIGVFRYLDRHQRLRLGVGYNWADFSDDLTKLEYDYGGWFINLTGTL